MGVPMKIRLAIWFFLLSGICAFGLGNNGVPPFFSGKTNTPDTLSVIDNFTATTGTTFTRTGLNFGANVAGRVIIVTAGVASTVPQQISSVTIGGTTATRARDCTSGSAGTEGCGIYYAVVSGTTGQTIVVTYTASVAPLFSYAAYRLIANSSIPTGGTTNLSLVTSVSVNVVPGGSVFVAGRIVSGTGAAFVYSGVDTLTTDEFISGASNTAANASILTTETAIGRTVKMNPTPGTTQGAVAVATWF